MQRRHMHSAVSFVIMQLDFPAQDETQIKLVLALAANHVPLVKPSHADRWFLFVRVQKRLALIIGEILKHRQRKEALPNDGGGLFHYLDDDRHKAELASAHLASQQGE